MTDIPHALTVQTIDVKTKLVSGDSFSITYQHCDEHAFTIEYVEGKVIITQIKKVARLPFFNVIIGNTAHVLISIPQSVEHIDMTGVNGMFLLNNLKVTSVHAQINNGSINAEGLTCNEMDVRCTNGSIYIQRILTHDRCQLHAKNGSITLKQVLNNDFGYQVDCNNGTCRLLGDFNGIKQRNGHPHYTVHCVNGSATLS